MSDIKLTPSKNGFSIKRNGTKTNWSITIASMVPVKKRTTIEHYYVLVIKDGKVLDRVLYEDGSLKWIYGKENIPAYVSNLGEYLLSTGDINRYSDKTIYKNKFTEFGLVKTES